LRCTDRSSEPTTMFEPENDIERTSMRAAKDRELGGLKSVSAAWLMLAMRAGPSDQSWVFGFEQNSDWNGERAAIGHAVAGNVLEGRRLDALPVDRSSFSQTLRGGIPIIAAKRGLFSKLFK